MVFLVSATFCRLLAHISLLLLGYALLWITSRSCGVMESVKLFNKSNTSNPCLNGGDRITSPRRRVVDATYSDYFTILRDHQPKRLAGQRRLS